MCVITPQVYLLLPCVSSFHRCIYSCQVCHHCTGVFTVVMCVITPHVYLQLSRVSFHMCGYTCHVCRHSTGAKSIEVKWEEPEELNGVLERYLVYLSTVEGEVGEVVHNTTIFFPSHIIDELQAGTTYYIAVGVSTPPPSEGQLSQDREVMGWRLLTSYMLGKYDFGGFMDTFYLLE